jgi:hypothetical protein
MKAPSSTSSSERRGYARVLLGAGALVLALAAFNALVDPHLYFDSPRIGGFNRWKTLFFWAQFDIKAARVEGYGASALILGTSTAGGTLDPAHPVFAGQRVFNSAIAGASPGVQHAVLRHALRSNPVRTLVVGVDLFAYNAYRHDAYLEAQANDLEPDGAAGRRWLRWRRQLENQLGRLFSWGAVRDALRTVTTQDPQQHADIRGDGFWQTPYNPAIPITEYFARSERHYLERGWFSGPRHRFTLGAARLEELQSLLDTACANDIQVNLAIMPVHARLLEAMSSSGLAPELDALRRRLVQRAEAAPCTVRVWDFSGYHGLSMSAVEGNPWFADAIHPTVATGNLMLERMLASPAAGVPADFGRLLEPATLEEAIAGASARQEQYRQLFPADVAAVRQTVADTRAWREGVRAE